MSGSLITPARRAPLTAGPGVVAVTQTGPGPLVATDGSGRVARVRVTEELLSNELLTCVEKQPTQVCELHGRY